MDLAIGTKIRITTNALDDDDYAIRGLNATIVQNLTDGRVRVHMEDEDLNTAIANDLRSLGVFGEMVIAQFADTEFPSPGFIIHEGEFELVG